MLRHDLTQNPILKELQIYLNLFLSYLPKTKQFHSKINY